MNKRARNRLIGVTAIIIIAIGAIVFGMGGGAYQKSVAEVVEDKTLVEKRVKVSGEVVEGSWNKSTSPMRFEIREKPAEGKQPDPDAPTLKVVYDGQAPNTFGDKVTAIVTGVLKADGTLEATEMMTQCPSKYESAASASKAETVESLLGNSKVVGKPSRVKAFIAEGSIAEPGADIRFTLRSASGKELPVKYDGGMPDGVKDGAEVVLGGTLGTDGVYDATSIAIVK